MGSETSPNEIVLLQNLDDGMVIERYIGFAKRFSPMDGVSCKWLQHNFRGVKVRVKRGDEILEMPAGRYKKVLQAAAEEQRKKLAT